MAKTVKNAPEPPEAPKGSGTTTKVPYEVWQCSVVKGEAKKIEKLRVAKITPEQADILNDGLLSGGNTIVEMYFPAESEEL